MASIAPKLERACARGLWSIKHVINMQLRKLLSISQE